MEQRPPRLVIPATRLGKTWLREIYIARFDDAIHLSATGPNGRSLQNYDFRFHMHDVERIKDALDYVCAGPLGRAAIDAEKQGEP